MTVTGSVFGLAYGDAIGKPTEFRSVAEIVERYGPDGPRDLPREPGTGIALVTDDTQMALAVADALAESLTGGHLAPDRLEPALRNHFLTWWRSPDNDRAPGFTCLNACEQLAGGTPWVRATVIGSKGCGANMRVTPIALPPGLSDDDRAGAAQLQAAMTHGHPTALAASELTMFAVRWLLDGATLGELPVLLRDRCRSQRLTYRDDWLGALWTRSHEESAATWISRGWDECVHALDRLDAAIVRPDRRTDPCLATGAGWIAEEALVTALHCVLLFPEDPVSALSRAAVTSGDSDSIAALAGAFMGAVFGLDGWPASWADRIEYGQQLRAVANLWDC